MSVKKILSVRTLKDKINSLRKKRKRIVFTNGCFDIVHYGHTSYLESAKKFGDILIVGMNSDKSVRSIKGRKRPIVKQQYRAAVLSALKCVDFITIFDDDTPYEVIKELKPDVLVKGSDWKGKKVVGSDIVKASGGKVKHIKFVKGCSTTSIIKDILRKCL